MEELKLSPLNLKKIIDDGIFLGEGCEGSVFAYQDKAIKLDKILYYLLKKHHTDECYKWVNYYYLGEKENFNDPHQIETLVKLQSKVKLSKLPRGIVTLDDVDNSNKGLCVGIIIPNLKDYSMLENLPKNDYYQVLIILKKLLLEVRELEKNGIFQEDMYHLEGNGQTSYNIMYKDTEPQLIDMSGEYVKINGNETSRKTMYDELGNVIIDFFDYYDINPPYNRWYTDSYEKNVELVKKLEMYLK